MMQGRERRVRAAVVILARTDSTRLSRKSLRRIAGKSILEHQLERLSTNREADRFVLATTTEAADDELCRVAAASGIDCFRGEREDVVLRLIHLADRFELDYLALINGDNLFCEGWLVDAVIAEFRRNPADLIRIGRQPFDPSPLGLRVEALRQVMGIKAGSTDGWERYMTDTGRFRVYDIPLNDPQIDGVYVRLDLDYPEDLELYETVYDRLYRERRQPPLKDVIRLLTVDEPELTEINSSATRKWQENRARVPLVVKPCPSDAHGEEGAP